MTHVTHVMRDNAGHRRDGPPPGQTGYAVFDGGATLVIRDLNTACPGLETPDGARLARVVAAGVPVRHACNAAAPYRK
ncbi:hypothetical protein ACV22V_01365 [Burkholderia sp. AW33-5]